MWEVEGERGGECDVESDLLDEGGAARQVPLDCASLQPRCTGLLEGLFDA